MLVYYFDGKKKINMIAINAELNMSIKKKIAKILNRWSWKLNPEYFPVAKVMIDEKVFDMKLLRTSKILTDKNYISYMNYPIIERQIKAQAIADLQREILPYINVTKVLDSELHSVKYTYSLFVGRKIEK